MSDDLIIGSGDLVRGGVGADTFHIMSEQVGDGEASIIDYNSEDDAITVIVDDTEADADVNVTVDGEDALIRIGDTVLARVEGAGATLEAADVTLIAQGTVEAMFDPNAVTTA